MAETPRAPRGTIARGARPGGVPVVNLTGTIAIVRQRADLLRLDAANTEREARAMLGRAQQLLEHATFLDDLADVLDGNTP